MAVRGNILYADSYSDLVALDISDPKNPKEVDRVGEVFQSGQFEGGSWSYNPSIRAINAQDVTYITETIETNCEDNPAMPGGWWGAGVGDAGLCRCRFQRSGGSQAAAPAAVATGRRVRWRGLRSTTSTSTRLVKMNCNFST